MYYHGIAPFDSLPNNKILDWTKFKILADDKINGIQKAKFLMEMVGNIAGKGENAGYQHFLLFPKCFQKAPFPGSLKVVGLKSMGLLTHSHTTTPFDAPGKQAF